MQVITTFLVQTVRNYDIIATTPRFLASQGVVGSKGEVKGWGFQGGGVQGSAGCRRTTSGAGPGLPWF